MREYADLPAVQVVEGMHQGKLASVSSMIGRLRVDTRKWLLSKALPKIYGDRLEVDAKAGLVVVETPAAIKALLEALPELGVTGWGARCADTVEYIHKCKVDLYLMRERIDTTTHTGKLLFGIIGSLAEFERATIQRRTAAGLDRVKATLDQQAKFTARKSGIVRIVSAGRTTWTRGRSRLRAPSWPKARAS